MMSYKVDELIEIAEALLDPNAGLGTPEVAALTAIAAALTALAKTTHDQYEYENALAERQYMLENC
jgi:hypothetical protein